MNNRSVLRALGLAAIVVAAAVVIGIGAYNAGVAQGIVESGRAVAAPPAGVPYVPYPYGWHRPWGFGFGVFPFFFLLFFFFALRGLFWRSRWHRGYGYGCGYGAGPADVPPAFDEWHRRAHAQQPPPPASGTTA